MYVMPDYSKLALAKHLELKGKISIKLKDDLSTREKLSIYYTPGVGAVSSFVADNPEKARDYTWLNNAVAVISDGSAVLGLGNIGPYGALPVMEGKSMLFKHFAGIDAVPIVLDVHSEDEIIAAVKAIAPSFGAINLEDIAAPICFNVETRLINELPIPVFHDDQHGTAIVTLAGLINAAKITKRQINDSKIVLVGSGAAGTAVAKLLSAYAPKADLLLVDSKGIISKSRDDLNSAKQELLSFTNPKNISGSLKDALKGADIFIGLSKPDLLNKELISIMNKNPIVFAMANPFPEIMPDKAYEAGVAVIATGRSDFPNQVNNALAFPGIFRGALDNNVRKITLAHKLAVAEVIAAMVENPTKDEIIPSVLDVRLVPAISKVIT
jgi:malate dehydrogenase (oxaloacetate-decarboxylating)